MLRSRCLRKDEPPPRQTRGLCVGQKVATAGRSTSGATKSAIKCPKCMELLHFLGWGSAKFLASPRKWSNPPVVSLRRELTGRQTNFLRV